MISIVIPLYNKERQIAKTLNTVIGQTFQDFEVVIVNDGSTDGSADVVRGFADPRIKLVSQENAGVSAARNRGVAETKNDWIAFLDGDDEWKPNYLAKVAELIAEHPEAEVIGMNYEMHTADGRVISTILNRMPFEKDGMLTNYFDVASCSNPPICSISVTVRKSAIQAIGGFPIGIKSGEDLLTWARLAARYKIAYSREPLAIFNVEGYDVKEKPKRIPAEDDVVGRELRVLAKEFNPPHINKYLATWHKMRSSVYMRLRLRKLSIREACKGLRHNPGNVKLYAFILLNLLPSKLQPF